MDYSEERGVYNYYPQTEAFPANRSQLYLQGNFVEVLGKRSPRTQDQTKGESNGCQRADDNGGGKRKEEGY